jgi:mevalonate kinase
MKTMSKYFVVVFLVFSSCVTKKVNVSKTQIETEIDSSFTQKKDSSVVQSNAISIIEKLDEIELVPIDTTKPIIINDTKYFNATIKLRKSMRAYVDSSKTISLNISQATGKIIKHQKQKANVKNVDKKANSQLYLFWLLLIPIVMWMIRKFYYVGN